MVEADGVRSSLPVAAWMLLAVGVPSSMLVDACIW